MPGISEMRTPLGPGAPPTWRWWGWKASGMAGKLPERAHPPGGETGKQAKRPMFSVISRGHCAPSGRCGFQPRGGNGRNAAGSRIPRRQDRVQVAPRGRRTEGKSRAKSATSATETAGMRLRTGEGWNRVFPSPGGAFCGSVPGTWSAGHEDDKSVGKVGGGAGSAGCGSRSGPRGVGTGQRRDGGRRAVAVLRECQRTGGHPGRSRVRERGDSFLHRLLSRDVHLERGLPQLSRNHFGDDSGQREEDRELCVRGLPRTRFRNPSGGRGGHRVVCVP